MVHMNQAADSMTPYSFWPGSLVWVLSGKAQILSRRTQSTQSDKIQVKGFFACPAPPRESCFLDAWDPSFVSFVVLLFTTQKK